MTVLFPASSERVTTGVFVRLDETGKAVEVREKKRISENCTLGAYYFKSCALYERLYDEFYANEGNL